LLLAARIRYYFEKTIDQKIAENSAGYGIIACKATDQDPLENSNTRGVGMASPKVLFIGLDAADPGLLARGCEEGWLPVLQGLRCSGAWAPVHVPAGFGDGAIWPSLFFGVNPARHGRYFNRQLKLGTYKIEKFIEDTDFIRKPMWEYLSGAGRRVAVIDMVKAPYSKDINGIQINDWTVHSRYGVPRSTPAVLISEVTTRYGADPFEGATDIPRQRSPEEYDAFRNAMVKRAFAKTALCEEYLKRDSWDLFMVAFGDPHDIGHQCWHLHDPAHAAYDAGWVERFGDPVKDVYVAVDTALGRLLGCVGPETTTIVFAGPGMGPNYSGNFLLEKVLRRLDGRPDRDRNLIPHAVVTRLRPAILQRLGERINAAKRRRAMRRRRCFAVPHNEGAGAVRINVVGREPAGCVKPGADYEAACKSIAAELLELVDANTGKPVFKEVIRVAEECRGPSIEAFPDLLAVWARDAPVRAIASPRISTVTGAPVVGARTGDHNWDCALFMQGSGVGCRGRLPSEVRVEDIAPTIAAMLDFVLPDCDGIPVSFNPN
jgi:predicted AlkP superfamily phosphohydrolase/phosphomutase